MTADGKITTREFTPVDFTSREDKLHLLRQRALADAVLVGHSTLKKDNVRLGLPKGELREERLARGQTESPLRVIVSNEGRIDASLKIFGSEIAPIVIFSTTRMPQRHQKALREKATLHLTEAASVDLTWMLRQLAQEYGVRSVACEGGAALFRSMIELGLIDQLNLTIAPHLFGGKKAPTLTGLSDEFLPASVRFSFTRNARGRRGMLPLLPHPSPKGNKTLTAQTLPSFARAAYRWRSTLSRMHTGNSIIMHAPKEAIFETAANLERWPAILPHYRYIHYLERSPTRNLVVMAATRSGIPISWTSEQVIDRDKMEVRFHHLKAFTKGMRVVWTFTDTPAGVLVQIVHDLQFRFPPLAPLADLIIGNFFIHHIASETLRHMKAHLETQALTDGHAKRKTTARGHHRPRTHHLHRDGPRRILARDSRGAERHPAHLHFRYHRLPRALRRRNSRLGAGESFPAAPAEAARSLRAIRRRLREDGAGRCRPALVARNSRSIASASASAPRLAGSQTRRISTRIFLKKGTRGVKQTLALQVFGGSAHSNIAIEFGFRGVGTTNSNSCASGTVAVGEALRYIRDDFADVIIAGGAEAPLSPLTFGAFAIIKTMSQFTGDPAQACRPFDLARDGFVMGEGAASLVIEELEHARKRGAHIYAEVLGYSLNNDAFHMTSPLPGGESCIRAMREALADAQPRARADRLRQRARQLHAAQRQHRDDGVEGSLRRARAAIRGQRNESVHRASARRHRGDRGGDLRAWRSSTTGFRQP